MERVHMIETEELEPETGVQMVPNVELDVIRPHQCKLIAKIAILAVLVLASLFFFTCGIMLAGDSTVGAVLFLGCGVIVLVPVWWLTRMFTRALSTENDEERVSILDSLPSFTRTIKGITKS